MDGNKNINMLLTRGRKHISLGGPEVSWGQAAENL